jgi:hypothetical protein
LEEIEELISTFSNLAKGEIRDRLLNLANNKIIQKQQANENKLLTV